MGFTAERGASASLWALGSVSPCGCTCTELIAAGMQRSHTSRIPGEGAALAPLGERGRGQRSPGESRQPRLAGAARRAAWHPPRISIFHSLAPQIASKEASQSNFLLLAFVVLQASNCSSPGKLSAPHFPILCHPWTRRGGNPFPSPAGPLCNRGPLRPRLPPSPAAGPPRTPGSRSLFLPGRRAEPLSREDAAAEPRHGGAGPKSCTGPSGSDLEAFPVPALSASSFEPRARSRKAPGRPGTGITPELPHPRHRWHT